MTRKHICILLILVVGIQAEVNYDDGLDAVPSGEKEDLEIDDAQVIARTMNPKGRYYSLSTCDYRATPGYTCIGCMTALHCYATSLAIVVDCRGLFPYCRDGHCSIYKTDRCLSGDNSALPSTPAIQTAHKENVTAQVASKAPLDVDSTAPPTQAEPNQTNEYQSVSPSNILTVTENPHKESNQNSNEIDAFVVQAEDNRVDGNPIKDNNEINSRLEIYSGLKRGALGDYSEISSAQLKRVRRT